MPEDVAPPLAGGRYALVEEIGAGGTALVYRAIDQLLGVERAIKELRPAFARSTLIRDRFLTEARTMARLEHKNIVDVLDVGVDGSRVFMVMKLVRGGSMAERLKKLGAVPPRMACDVMVHVLEALQCAHDHNVVHRDIKPGNVLVTRGGTCLVTDFGIAHVADEDLSLTKTGVTMGTMAFMAPEQKVSARRVDARSDLYAVAATLYNLLSDVEPFDLHSEKAREELFQFVPRALIPVLSKASEYDKSERYRNANEMIAAIREVYSELPMNAETTVPLGADLSPYQAPDAPLLKSLTDAVREDWTPSSANATLKSPAKEPPPPPPSTESDEEPVSMPSQNLSLGGLDDYGGGLGFDDTDPDLEPKPSRRKEWAMAAGLLLVAVLGAAAWLIGPAREETRPETVHTPDAGVEKATEILLSEDEEELPVEPEDAGSRTAPAPHRASGSSAPSTDKAAPEQEVIAGDWGGSWQAPASSAPAARAAPSAATLPQSLDYTPFTVRFSAPGVTHMDIKCHRGSGAGTPPVTLSNAGPGPCRVTATSAQGELMAMVSISEAHSFVCFEGGAAACR